MSMISELVKKLKDSAYVYKAGGYPEASKLFLEAANTIENLSVKLATANMDRPSIFCGKEKALIEEMVEEIENCYGRETELSERAREYLLKADYGAESDNEYMYDCVAYMPLPEPYNINIKNNNN